MFCQPASRVMHSTEAWCRQSSVRQNAASIAVLCTSFIARPLPDCSAPTLLSSQQPICPSSPKVSWRSSPPTGWNPTIRPIQSSLKRSATLSDGTEHIHGLPRMDTSGPPIEMHHEGEEIGRIEAGMTDAVIAATLKTVQCLAPGPGSGHQGPNRHSPPHAGNATAFAQASRP